jgi:trimeric autotransporter adhesin
VRAVHRILTVLTLALAATGCGGSAKHAVTQTTPRPPAGPAIGVVLGSNGALTARLTGDGSIAAAAPDGRGGWFIAGSFTQVDGVLERGLAHVLAGGTVDRQWHGTLASSGRTALAAAGGLLYAAGSIGDTDRSRLLVLDAATGALRRTLPVPFGPISALTVESSLLFVATSTSTDPRRPSCLEAIDVQTGRSAGGVSADIRPAPELGCIVGLRLNGSWLYVMGAFQEVDGVRRPGIARIDPASGRLDTTWSPPATAAPGMTNDVAIGPGGAFLAGSRPGVTVLSLATGAPEHGWHAPAGVENALSLAIAGGRLFVAGDFNGGVAVLALPGGAPLASWRPAAGQLARLATASGSAVLLALGRR